MIIKNDIAKILQRFATLPNAPEQSKITNVINSFFEVCQDLPLEMLEAAASAYLATGRFFPSPSDFRQKAIEISLLAMNVPSASEAWAQVINASPIIHTVRCDKGNELRLNIDGKSGNQYWAALAEYSSHTDNCPNCYDAHEKNWHPAVKSAFEAMGGDNGVFTDNRTADRARFLDGYQTFVEREVLRLSMPQDVRAYIEEKQMSLPQAQVKQLAERLSNGTKTS